MKGKRVIRQKAKLWSENTKLGKWFAERIKWKRTNGSETICLFLELGKKVKFAFRLFNVLLLLITTNLFKFLCLCLLIYFQSFEKKGKENFIFYKLLTHFINASINLTHNCQSYFYKLKKNNGVKSFKNRNNYLEKYFYISNKYLKKYNYSICIHILPTYMYMIFDVYILRQQIYAVSMAFLFFSVTWNVVQKCMNLYLENIL